MHINRGDFMYGTVEIFVIDKFWLYILMKVLAFHFLSSYIERLPA